MFPFLFHIGTVKPFQESHITRSRYSFFILISPSVFVYAFFSYYLGSKTKYQESSVKRKSQVSYKMEDWIIKCSVTLEEMMNSTWEEEGTWRWKKDERDKQEESSK